MRSFVDALYDPNPPQIVEERDPRRDDPLSLFQLASAGNFEVLFAIRSGAPWEADGPGDLGEVSPLAGALVDYVTGGGPTDGLQDVSGPDGEETAAAVIAAVQLADVGRGPAACDVLRDALARSSDDPLGDRAALNVQLGLRCAELGEWDEAIERTAAVIEICDEAGFEQSSVVAERVLLYVATQNLDLYNQYGRGVFTFARNGPRRTFPDLITASIAEGLNVWMDKDFEAAFADPNSRSVTFASGDRSERAFLGAVVRSELVGSWRWRRLSRRALGRHSLRSVVGQSRGEVATGIATLIEAEDSKGLALASRHFRRYGPLSGVAEVAASLVAEQPWGSTRVASSIAVLREAAELLTEESALRLATRMANEFEELRRPTPMTNLTSDILSLLAQVARHWRAEDTQTTIADAVLRWLRQSDDALLQQRSASVVRAVDWTAVHEETVANWREHALAHLDGDTGYPSRAFLEAAPDSGELARAALREAFRRTGDLGLGIVLLQVGGMDPADSDRLVEEAAEWVHDRSAEARRGVFGMYSHDNVLVLAIAALHGVTGAWAPLIEFLGDTAVPLIYKEQTLRYLRDRADDLQDDWRDEIATSGAALGTGADVLFPAPTSSVDAASLRLITGGLSADQARAEVVRAATSGDASERAAAVRMLVDAREVVGSDATIMTLLLLTRDRHPEVRGEAGRYLSRVAHDADPDLGTRARLLEMLREPGTFVPSAVLFGIHEEGLRFAELVGPCTALAEEHLSVEVRSLAKAVVALQASTE